MNKSDLIISGEKAFDIGEFDLAISLYRKAVASDPEDYEVVFRLGSLLYHQFQFFQAETLYSEAISRLNTESNLDENLGNLHIALGEVYLKLHRLEDAEAQFVKASQLRADQAMLHTGLGNLYFEKGQYTKAIVEYDKQIALDPTGLDGFLGKALVYQQQKKYEIATDVLKAAQLLVRENYNIELAFGNLAADQQDYSNALSHFIKADQLAPFKPAIKYSLARTYLELEDFIKAQELFGSVLKQNSNDANALYGMAIVEKSLGHNQEAIAYLESAIIAQPLNASYYQLLFYTQLSSRKWLSAIRTALLARKIHK